jgi:hypothetical protein
MKLQCPVEGDPPPLIMWAKDGRNIHSGWMRFRVLRQALRIKEVEAEDAGTFICKATNGFGSVNINYTLIVVGESPPPSHPPCRVPDLFNVLGCDNDQDSTNRPETKLSTTTQSVQYLLLYLDGSQVDLICFMISHGCSTTGWLVSGSPLIILISGMAPCPHRQQHSFMLLENHHHLDARPETSEIGR